MEPVTVIRTPNGDSDSGSDSDTDDDGDGDNSSRDGDGDSDTNGDNDTDTDTNGDNETDTDEELATLEVVLELIKAIQDGGKLLRQLSRRCRFQIENQLAEASCELQHS